MEISSPGKINLHLEIGSRRNDGYHDLCSVFQMIDLQDSLRVALLPWSSGFCLACREYALPEENTIHHAWTLFVEETSLRFGCSVSLEKRIPPEAGLGGGSSNAAAMLTALNVLTGFPLSVHQLKELGRRIGCDVPFFFSPSAAAVVEGTGDIISPTVSQDSFSVLVVKPPFGVSTAWAYSSLDQMRYDPESYDFRLSRDDCLESCVSKDPGSWNFFNSFEPVLFGRYQELPWIKDQLHSSGACFSLLSGSGSAAAGLFRDPDDGERCLEKIKNIYWAVRVKILANSPFAVYNTH